MEILQEDQEIYIRTVWEEDRRHKEGRLHQEQERLSRLFVSALSVCGRKGMTGIITLLIRCLMSPIAPNMAAGC